MSGVTYRAHLGGKGLVIRTGECKGGSAWWCVYVNGSLSEQVCKRIEKQLLFCIVFCILGAWMKRFKQCILYTLRK